MNTVQRERRYVCGQTKQNAIYQEVEIYTVGTDKRGREREKEKSTPIWPRELAGEIDHVERHVRFELLPKAEYCGISLPAAHYTPDFLIYYKDGTVEAVEVKHEAIRKNQRDYIYRRRLFIDNVARPNGWRFTEYIKREDKKQ